MEPTLERKIQNKTGKAAECIVKKKKGKIINSRKLTNALNNGAAPVSLSSVSVKCEHSGLDHWVA